MFYLPLTNSFLRGPRPLDLEGGEALTPLAH